MFKNYFKIAWRNLFKNKTQSFINISGLSVGLACSILIFLWVQNELAIDAFHTNDDRLYKVYEREYYADHVDGNYDTPGLLADELKKKIPEVQDAVMLEEQNELTTLQSGEKILKAEGSGASETFFNVFSYPVLQGTANGALSSVTSVSISKKLASEFFGNAEQAIGKTIRFNNKKDYIVTAVFENVALSSRKFDYLISWKALQQDEPWIASWQNSGPLTFVLLKPGANASLVDKKIANFRNFYSHDSTAAYHVELGLQKYDEVYLHNHFENGKIAGGRMEYVFLFTVIAIFILLIACINFMNLATARSINRAKEVGVRKVIGAERSSLIGQFIAESLLLTMCATAVAFMLVILLLPIFDQVTQKQIQLPFQNISFWLEIAAILTITGLIAGSYPALYLSSFNPIKVLKGATKLSIGAVWFRKSLVVFQFVLSMILITGTIVISRQINFIQSKNLGYDKENLLCVPLEGELSKNYQAFKNEALRIQGIKSVTYISDNPAFLDQWTNGVDWEGRAPNTLISFEHPAVNYDFVKTMNLQMVSGRDFSKEYPTDKDGFLLNETAIKDINYSNPIGKDLTVNGHHGKIIGVIKDFHFRSLHEAIKPMVIELSGKENYGEILLRIEAGKTKQAIADLEKACREINPAFPFTYSFADEEYQKLYNNEQVISKLSDAFSFLAIFISCLGLLGLVMFTTEQRTKEIGIRKVLGASFSNIIKLMSADFLQLVAVAILIASPVAWWAMKNWLNNYAYKIDIAWWMFALAGAVIIIIAICTICIQSIKAAIANPVKSLRSE
ncbi:MAG: ABC transporter permease [Bacteroidetes bacterium]|nr:ABC transporter permease [Bacteroidota bacterium]